MSTKKKSQHGQFVEGTSTWGWAALDRALPRGGAMSLALIVMVGVTSACGDAATESAEDALDAAETITNEGGLFRLAATTGAPSGVTGVSSALSDAAAADDAPEDDAGDDDDGSVTPTEEVIAARAAATIGSLLVPAGCSTSTQNRNVVTVEVNGCTGPYGLIEMTGTIIYTYKLRGTAISIVGSATGFQVNGATLDIASSGLYTTDGDERTLTMTTSGEGTGRFGRPLDRDGSYTLTWNVATGCFELDGTWTTEGTERALTTTVTEFASCPGQCPSGGTIERAFDGVRRDIEVTVSFDGSAAAEWQSSDASGTVNLACGTTDAEGTAE